MESAAFEKRRALRPPEEKGSQVMASTLDCVICLMRQSLEAARFATKNEEMHAQILERVMKLFIERGVTASPPIIGTVVHRVVREITGDDDPYAAEKRRFNRDAYARWDDIQRSIKTARDPFEAAVRLAIAGNSIDFALESINEEKVNAAIANALDAPLRGSSRKLDPLSHRQRRRDRLRQGVRRTPRRAAIRENGYGRYPRRAHY